MTAIAVDWPEEVLERPETGCRFSGPGIAEEPSTNVDVEAVERELEEPLLIRVFSDRWETVLRLDLFRCPVSYASQPNGRMCCIRQA